MPDPLGRPTLRDLIAEIEDDIERADLGRQVATAVERAIRHYQPVRFSFNERVLTFPTIPDIDVYGRGDALAIPELVTIDSVVLVENERAIPLRRVPETSVEFADDPTFTAQPRVFSYFDRSFRLWPMPSAVWTIRFSGHIRLDPPVLEESNAWTDEASNLIAAWAKRHLALNSLRNSRLAQAQDALVTSEERRLRARSNAIASTGQIAAYDL